MTVLVYMLLAAAGVGAIALATFIWALRSGQFDDPKGSGARILVEEDVPRP